MVNMITASRAYEAGVTSLKATQQMADSALSLGRG
jgi:flagellar basal body rod protein FlgC